jgi:hypothetical protein
MGLDNGIYIKEKENEERKKLQKKQFFWGDEVAYWRKCWGIRRVILDILNTKEGDYGYAISRDKLKEIIIALKKFNKKEYWDAYADSIWTFEEFADSRKRILRNLRWLHRYMYFHPETEVYFYDSY